MKKNSGFTLIELLIVIVIIGVLATLAVPMYTGFILKARIAEANAFMGTIQRAQEVYRMEAGHYADDLSELNVGLPPADARYWLYSIDTNTNITDPSGFAYNDYIIVAHPNTNHPGMSGIAVHPHMHSDRTIGEWHSNAAPHAHGEDYSHAHSPEYGNPY